MNLTFAMHADTRVVLLLFFAVVLEYLPPSLFLYYFPLARESNFTLFFIIYVALVLSHPQRYIDHQFSLI